MSEMYCSECEQLFDIDDAICPDCATVRWLDPTKAPLLDIDYRMLGLFEVEASWFVNPVTIFRKKQDGHYYGDDGSHLPPEYKKLIAWCPIPRTNKVDF